MRKIVRKIIRKITETLIDPYDIRSLKRFHGIMTKYLVKESGEFRSGEKVFSMERNLIRMTIPDKPNSRNQRYVIV